MRRLYSSPHSNKRKISIALAGKTIYNNCKWWLNLQLASTSERIISDRQKYSSISIAWWIELNFLHAKLLSRGCAVLQYSALVWRNWLADDFRVEHFSLLLLNRVTYWPFAGSSVLERTAVARRASSPAPVSLQPFLQWRWSWRGS